MKLNILKGKVLSKRFKGMTLIEILIVIGIIAFLAVLISSYLRSQIFKGNDARRKAEIKKIAIAVEEYEKDNNCYPLPSLLSCTTETGLRPYIDKIPCDPTTKASYIYEHEDSDCPRWYKIYGVLDNESDTDYMNGIGPNDAFNYVYESSNAPSADTESGGDEGNGGGQPPDTDFYGCLSGVCTLIQWDSSRPGPVCDPNYQNPSCYGQCGNPANQCESWN